MPPRKSKKRGSDSESDSEGSTYSDEETAYNKRKLNKLVGKSKSDKIKQQAKKEKKARAIIDKDMPSEFAPMEMKDFGASFYQKVPLAPRVGFINYTHAVGQPFDSEHFMSQLRALPNQSLTAEEVATYPVAMKCKTTQKYFIVPAWFAQQHFLAMDAKLAGLRQEIEKEYPVPDLTKVPTILTQRYRQKEDGSVVTEYVEEVHPMVASAGKFDLEMYKTQQLRVYENLLNSIQREKEKEIHHSYFTIDSTTLPPQFDPPVRPYQSPLALYAKQVEIAPDTLFSFINAYDQQLKAAMNAAEVSNPTDMPHSQIIKHCISIGDVQYPALPLGPNPDLSLDPTWSPQGYSEEDIEDGEFIAFPSKAVVQSEPFSFPQLGLIPFTTQQYDEIYAHPHWTMYETFALFDFVIRHQPDSFYLARSDNVLSARHTWEECLERWLAICAIAAAAGQLSVEYLQKSYYAKVDQTLIEQARYRVNQMSNKNPNKVYFHTDAVTFEKNNRSTDVGLDVPIITPIEYEPLRIATSVAIINTASINAPQPPQTSNSQTSAEQQGCELTSGLQDIPLPADLASQLMPADERSYRSLGFQLDLLSLGRNNYSQSYQNLGDNMDVAIQAGCPSNLSINLPKISGIATQSNADMDVSGPRDAPRSKRLSKAEQAKADDEYDYHSEEDAEEGAPITGRRRSTRAATRRVVEEEEEEENNEEGSDSGSGSGSGSGEEEGDEQSDDMMDESDYDMAPAEPVELTLAQKKMVDDKRRVDRLLAAKRVKKRVVFRIDGKAVTPEYIAELHALELKEQAQMSLQQQQQQQEKAISPEEEEERTYYVYEQELRSFIHDEYDLNEDDYSLNGLHFHFTKEFSQPGWEDDDEDHSDNDDYISPPPHIAEYLKTVFDPQSLPTAIGGGVQISTDNAKVTVARPPVTTAPPIPQTNDNNMSMSDDITSSPTTATTASTPPTNNIAYGHYLNPDGSINTTDILPYVTPFILQRGVIPPDALTAQAYINVYLIKETNMSYHNARWHSESQMARRYGEKIAADRIKRWEVKREEIEAENNDKYGGEPYDPRFNEIDRIISSDLRLYKLRTLIEEMPVGFSNWEELGYKIIPKYCTFRFVYPDSARPELVDIEIMERMTRAEAEIHWATASHNPGVLPKDVEDCVEYDIIALPSYYVKWGGMGYGDATWEPKAFLHDEQHIGQYNRFSRRPTADQLIPKAQLMTHEQLFERRNRAYRWHEQSPKYKGGNTLREYQVQGINWLIQCFIQEKNAILADEMGLGKTVQCITFLEHLRREENFRGPFLIVAPLSTLPNWKSEAETWTDMNAILYHDSTGARGREILRTSEFFYPGTTITKFNIMITSYEMILADTHFLKECNFKYVIIDEGHRLKNKTAKLMDAFTELDIDRRLLLTGTPIQNNMIELWTLLNFLEPRKFADQKDFKRKFGELSQAKQVEELQNTINPYILRRMKETVEKSIPNKEETVINIELTLTQKKYYRAIYERNLKFLKQGVTQHNTPKLINIESELRKVCNHPWLVVGAEDREISTETPVEQRFAQTVAASGKLVLLDKLLPKLFAEGHRVLIFSQMVSMLDLLSEYLRFKGWKHERLDGSITGDQRAAAIDRFCRPDSDRFIFLLSTRAGGVGLNLTSADTVIIYDSDWNPQQDVQAQARAHRIGQKKDVSIYRLVTRNTYESEMFSRASKKLGLDHAVLKKLEVNEKGQGTKRNKNGANSDREDIDHVLRYGAYGILEDDDNEDRQRFFDGDIDQILQQNTYTINHSGAKKEDGEGGMQFDGGLAAQEQKAAQLKKQQQQQQQKTMGVAYNKQYFSADENAQQVDINDQHFWNRILAASGDSEYKYTADALLSRLTIRDGIKTDEDKIKFCDDLKIGYDRVLERRAGGEYDISDVDEFIALLDQFTSMTKTFSKQQISDAEDWADELQRTARQRNRNTTSLDNLKSFEMGYANDNIRSRYLEGDSDYDEDDEDEDDDEDNEEDSERAPKPRQAPRNRLPVPKFNDDSSDYEESYGPKLIKPPTHNKPGTRVCTVSEQEELGPQWLVLKENAGIDGDLLIPISKKGKGARPLQHNFVCSKCHCPGDLIACDGHCARLFHRECCPKGAPKLGTQGDATQYTRFQGVLPPQCPEEFVPRTLEAANELLVKAGKAELEDDGLDYIPGPNGHSDCYMPPTNPDVLARTHWECAECVTKTWRCTLCDYPVQAVESKKKGKGRKSTVAAEDDEAVDENNDENENDENDDAAPPPIPGADGSTVSARNKTNQSNSNAAGFAEYNAKVNTIPVDKFSFGKFCHISLCGKIAHLHCIHNEKYHVSREASLGNTNPTKFKNYRCSAHVCMTCYESGVDLDVPKKRGKAATLAKEKEDAAAAASLIDQELVKIEAEQAAQLDAIKAFLNPPDVHRHPETGQPFIYHPVVQNGQASYQQIAVAIDPITNQVTLPPHIMEERKKTYADQEAIVTQTFAQKIQQHNLKREEEKAVADEKAHAEAEAATEAPPPPPKDRVERDENGEEIFYDSTGKLISRQKYLQLQTNYPCISCNGSFHLKCFPRDHPDFIRPSKRQIMCPKCSHNARKSEFGSRVIQLAEWSYSIPLLKDRVTVPMHAGPKRGEVPPPKTKKTGGRAKNTNIEEDDDEEDEAPASGRGRSRGGAAGRGGASRATRGGAAGANKRKQRDFSSSDGSEGEEEPQEQKRGRGRATGGASANKKQRRKTDDSD